ncbi:hypothetical protein [Thermodesulforhabdus norvegica]|uniref:Uncharacterized protein n=1 Tax=Thermodesulforhabdus norvegica TaxID=39841 RepID=A0A1I4QRL6_9BACT|nr:hypothetical protein [Thermodesulforhabdus norvegica]SFM42350.1 hypothetical protein SAMN05660836_00170 [Thermodesulforhabdus norvegica]
MQWNDRDVEFIRSLAESYHKKLSVVDEKTRNLRPFDLWNFMRISGERIVDSYREAQSKVLRQLSLGDSGSDLFENFRLLAEHFDEMHVLFFKLLERYYKDTVKDDTERSQGLEDVHGSG